MSVMGTCCGGNYALPCISCFPGFVYSFHNARPRVLRMLAKVALSLFFVAPIVIVVSAQLMYIWLLDQLLLDQP